MSTKDFTANVISATKVVPDGNFKDSKASGVWDINEALDLIKGGNWPNVANFNPDAFVDALFQCHLWDGSGSSRSITNNINLSGSGGLVWYKGRDTGGQGATQRHSLYDTERGVTKRLISNENHAESTEGTGLTAFNTTGFTIGGDAETNQSNYDYVSWTFREQPKFFDIVKYEGTGSDRTVAHSLGTTVGMIIIKNLDQTDNWAVYHREAYDQNAGADYVLHLNTNSARTNSSDYFNDTAPTSSVFTVGTDHTVNASGENYIAYLFAHNNDDGGFGEPGDQDIIKCGSYDEVNGVDVKVDLGFEPQWIMIKVTSTTGGWGMYDVMRGWTSGTDDFALTANTSDAESSVGDRWLIHPDGFTWKNTGNTRNIIYMAIRRGGMQTPTAATDVFGMEDYNSGGSGPVTGIVTDFSIVRDRDADAANYAATRILGKNYLTPMLNSAEVSSNGAIHDRMDGAWNTSFAGYMIWGWQRARGYFDVVVYSGPDGAGNISHNLGVVPEMIWVKNADATENWAVYHKDLGNTYYLHLNTTAAASNTDGGNFWNSTTPTASVFSVGTSTLTSHYTRKHVAYLFATVANVSKVGSFTQSGATNVACGFTGSTPALIILKRTDASGNWYILDAVRGIVAGNDPHTYINESNPEISNVDLVDPYSGGFATTSSLADGDYIFYAIASIA